MILGIDCSRYHLPNPTGVEKYTNRLVEALISQLGSLGYDEIRLYCQRPEQELALKELLEKNAQTQAKIVLIPKLHFWTLLHLSIELYRHPIDLLFVPSHTMPFVIPKKSLLTVHGFEALTYPEAYSIIQSLYQQVMLWHSKWLGTGYIAVSNAVKEDLKKFFVMPEKRITTIYHGYERVKKSKEERKPLVEGDYILHIGRLEERKNQCRLIEAFESIAQEHKKLFLVLVGGDGYGAKKIHQKVEKSSVKDRVHLTGYQDEEMIFQLLEKAKVFAYPSLSEGFGMPILEAFDAGVPVLTSKGSATEEITGDSGLLCDALSVESIAQGLKILLSDDSIRQEKIRRGKKRLEQFSWERCVEETKRCLLA